MVAAQKTMITILGSINVDIVFRMSHLPAPGETVLCPRYETVAGGKGANQALAAARAGGQAQAARHGRAAASAAPWTSTRAW